MLVLGTPGLQKSTWQDNHYGIQLNAWPQARRSHMVSSTQRRGDGQRDPQVILLAKCFFGGLRYPGHETHMFMKIVVVWHCRRGRQGQKTSMFLNCIVSWPWHSWPPKKHLAGKPLRDPVECMAPSPTTSYGFVDTETRCRSKGSRSDFVGQVVCRRPGVTRTKNHTCSGK